MTPTATPPAIPSEPPTRCVSCGLRVLPELLDELGECSECATFWA
jgi:hypothetical protein